MISIYQQQANHKGDSSGSAALDHTLNLDMCEEILHHYWYLTNRKDKLGHEENLISNLHVLGEVSAHLLVFLKLRLF